jgi:anti-sigma regulatory factor (Ser/Thr protein kinase)
MADDRNRPPPDVRFDFEHDEDAPRDARRALRPLFPQPDRLANDVGLVASELVSNVIRHTDEGGLMQAWDDDPLRLEVSDTDPTLPSVPGEADEHGGYGLRIVDDVTDEWGARREANGKTLWAEFRRRRNDRE